jgi:hypothetical protein
VSRSTPAASGRFASGLQQALSLRRASDERIANRSQNPQMVWVDGYFPCYRPAKSSHTGKYKLIFGKSADCKEIWPIVIEKAFAKLHGPPSTMESAGVVICQG